MMLNCRTMSRRVLFLGLLVYFMVDAGETRGVYANHPSDDDNLQQVDPAVLNEALREMFGLHHITASSSPSVSSQMTGDSNEAANYMMTLYERYKDGSTLTYKHHPANTVRGIVPTTEIIDGQLMYIFNVSNFATSDVFGGELHVMRKKTGSKKFVSVQVSSLGCPSLDEEELRDVNQTDKWYSLDVTKELHQCLDRASLRRYGGTGINLLTLTSYFKGADDQTVPINGKKVVRYISKPFLVVYLNETQTLTQDHVDPRFKADDAITATKIRDPASTAAFYNPETGTLEYYDIAATQFGDHWQPAADEERPTAAEANDTTSVVDDDWQHKRRRRRSTIDNEIPEIPENYPPPVYAIGGGSGYHHRDTAANKHKIIHPPPYPEQKPKGRNNLGGDRHSSGVAGEKDNGDSRLIPYPPNYPTRSGNQNKKGRKNRKKQLFQSPAPWKQEEGQFGENDAANSLVDLCARRRLIIDFADIGWSEWMISPRSFEAHYCAGACPFPLPQRLRPSNHATIQSLVHTLGVYQGVPAPCCVPDSMSSVTLLYFDENKNVIEELPWYDSQVLCL